MRDATASLSAVSYVGGMFSYLTRAVRFRLKSVVLIPLVAALVVFVADWMRPVGYAAQAVVRVGRVDGAEVAPMSSIVFQMNSASFKRRAFGTADSSADGDAKARRLILDSFDVRPATSEMLALSVGAPSEQAATEALQAAVRTLNADQEKIRAPALSEVNTQIALVDSNIASLIRVREELASLGSIGVSDPASLMLRRVWLLDLIVRNEEKLVAATNDRRALAERMGPSKTYPATLSDDVTVRQVSPNPLRHAIFAGAIVLLIMLVYAMVSRPASA
ncbi:hypothetical protein [Bradyrhizobium japonicum]|jgi:hypothetical protein|uniref:hypothetical protein n=1 Tax=Bradyrhizobium japonicum TaxID=375 RepID=UPI00209FBD5F|nr:hypothetical protein [Bradyrhizobium japonicum]MCP1764429.1 hypothetical protein [Bradyrhizobium japonicum]MCP1786567.1 hypothetical protein [Bradyrhizobium japonicum]MCP1808445.1 hypothetical protein [Bradyrhizobium japonicum]MCP1817372.1 hypothetical protein [Bradyrhizobium japonicum]MCP1871115.1 hypothetical protein [Bradyrhizobium japonicum]